MFLKKQANVSPYRGMPVVWVLEWEKSTQIVSEAPIIKYFNGTTLTTDVNSAAWTPIIIKLWLGWIKNQLLTALGKYGDSSLSITATVLDTEVESTPEMFEAVDLLWLKEWLTQLTKWLSDGQYIVDYQKWVIYGKKKNDLIIISASYSVWASTAASQSYTKTLVRDAIILTNSYVVWTVIWPVDTNNQLIIYAAYVKWDSTSAQIKVEFSDDWTNYYQESFGAITTTTDTLSLWEHSMTATWNYRIPVSIKDKYIKISTKCVWTVTNSSMKIDAIVGNQ